MDTAICVATMKADVCREFPQACSTMEDHNCKLWHLCTVHNVYCSIGNTVNASMLNDLDQL